MNARKTALTLTLALAIAGGALATHAPDGAAQGVPVPAQEAPPTPPGQGQGDKPAPGKPAAKDDKGWLGVGLEAIPVEEAKKRGYDHPLVRITQIFNDSPAHASDLREGDVFLKLDGVTITSNKQMVETVTGHAPGDKIILTMLRDKETFTVPIILALRPGRVAMMKGQFMDRPAPAFTVTPPKAGQKPVTLASHKGKVVLVDFWATWCGPCRRVMPHLDAMAKKNKARGLVVLGVTDEDAETITKFSRDNPVGYPLLTDPDRAAHKAYSVSALPTLFVIDRKGVVREIFLGGGEKNLAALEETLDKLLKEK